jgi:hypothetical protein
MARPLFARYLHELLGSWCSGQDIVAITLPVVFSIELEQSPAALLRRAVRTDKKVLNAEANALVESEFRNDRSLPFE